MDDTKIKLLQSQLGDIRIKRAVELAEYLEGKTTSKAAALFIATSQSELINILDLLTELKLPHLLIGSGSKVVVSQEMFDGLVIKNRSDAIKIFGIKGAVSKEGLGIREAMLEVDSGVTLRRLADYCSKQQLAGFADSINIPGTIGGSLLVNKDLRDKVTLVKVWTASKLVDRMLEEVNRDDIIISVMVKLKRQTDD